MNGGPLAQAVLGASNGEYFFALLIGSVIALACSWGAYTMLIRKRVLQDTPTALIRSASQGYIELKGHAELMDGLPIVAPLSTRSCVWYRYKVEEKQRSTHGNGSRSEWRTLVSDTSDGLFYLVDGTGRCAVDPEGAKVTPSSRNVWYGNSRVPGRLEDNKGWLRFTGINQIGRRFRFTEMRIEPGDPIYAIGDFKTHGGAGAHFDRKADVGDLLREWKADNAGVLARFDKNKDGEIDMQEWEAARAAAEKAVDAQHADNAVAPSVDVLGLARGSRNPFILSAKTEEEMMARFHWSAVACLSGAFISIVSVLWMLTIR